MTTQTKTKTDKNTDKDTDRHRQTIYEHCCLFVTACIWHIFASWCRFHSFTNVCGINYKPTRNICIKSICVSFSVWSEFCRCRDSQGVDIARPHSPVTGHYSRVASYQESKLNSLYGKFSLTEGKFATVSEDCLHQAPETSQYSRIASEFSLKSCNDLYQKVANFDSFDWRLLPDTSQYSRVASQF